MTHAKRGVLAYNHLKEVSNNGIIYKETQHCILIKPDE